MSERTCSIEDCDRPHLARDWCRAHYLRWYKTGDVRAADPIAGGVLNSIQDFWDRVVPEGDCWVWGGTNNGAYGVFSHQGTPWLAHRFAYVTLTDEDIEGRSLDHRCLNTLCVNPDHLDNITQSEHTYRSRDSRMVAHRRGTCTKGHPRSESVLRRGTNKVVYCKACRREKRAGGNG